MNKKRIESFIVRKVSIKFIHLTNLIASLVAPAFGMGTVVFPPFELFN